MINFRKNKTIQRIACLFVTISFLSNAVLPGYARAQELFLPSPQQFVGLSNSYSFPVLKGLKFDPATPFNMQFIIDTADQKDIDKDEASRLIKYFFAGLTIPEKDTWVNMSSYEKDRIIPSSLSETDLGKDLLSLDYILKQVSVSLTYPESEIGKDFWSKTYAAVLNIAHTTNLPVNTFNKIWIMPDKAEVYEHENFALVHEATLKTMLEEDYLALKNNISDIQKQKKNMKEELIEKINKASSDVMRDFILPKINKDVNSGKNFATLRQIYYALVLGVWFKKKFKDSIYKYYINQGKVKGIDINDKDAKDKIYNLYIEGLKKGLYNYIKSDYDPGTRRNIKRQYFSGGFTLNGLASSAIVTKVPETTLYSPDNLRGPGRIVEIAGSPIGAGTKDSSKENVKRIAELKSDIESFKERITEIKRDNESLGKDILSQQSLGYSPGLMSGSIIKEDRDQIERNNAAIGRLYSYIADYERELKKLITTAAGSPMQSRWLSQNPLVPKSGEKIEYVLRQILNDPLTNEMHLAVNVSKHTVRFVKVSSGDIPGIGRKNLYSNIEHKYDENVSIIYLVNTFRDNFSIVEKGREGSVLNIVAERVAGSPMTKEDINRVTEWLTPIVTNGGQTVVIRHDGTMSLKGNGSPEARKIFSNPPYDVIVKVKQIAEAVTFQRGGDIPWVMEIKGGTQPKEINSILPQATVAASPISKQEIAGFLENLNSENSRKLSKQLSGNALGLAMAKEYLRDLVVLEKRALEKGEKEKISFKIANLARLIEKEEATQSSSPINAEGIIKLLNDTINKDNYNDPNAAKVAFSELDKNRATIEEIDTAVKKLKEEYSDKKNSSKMTTIYKQISALTDYRSFIMASLNIASLERSDLRILITLARESRINELAKSKGNESIDSDELTLVLSSISDDEYDRYYAKDESRRDKDALIDWLSYLVGYALREKRIAEIKEEELKEKAYVLLRFLVETRANLSKEEAHAATKLLLEQATGTASSPMKTIDEYREEAIAFLNSLFWKGTNGEGKEITHRIKVNYSQQPPEGKVSVQSNYSYDDLGNVTLTHYCAVRNDIDPAELMRVVSQALIKDLDRKTMEQIRSQRDSLITSLAQESYGEVSRLQPQVAGSPMVLTPEVFTKKLQLSMNMLEKLKEPERMVGILRNAIDAIALVERLAEKTGKSIEQVLAILKKVPGFEAKAYKYEMLKAKLSEKGLDPSESTSKFISISVDKDGSSLKKIIPNVQGIKEGGLLSNFLLQQFKDAAKTVFTYRDDMQDYVRRLFDPSAQKAKYYQETTENGKQLNDLWDSIGIYADYLIKQINVADIDNFITQGQGANIMYLRQLTPMINQLARDLGVSFHMDLADNPTDVERVIKNGNNPNAKNTIWFDMSRSGTTAESCDLLELTSSDKNSKYYFNKRIIWSNGNRMHKLGKALADSNDPDAAVLQIDNTPGNIGGRHMNLKTDMVYGPLFSAFFIIGYKLHSGAIVEQERKEVAKEWAIEQLKVYVNALLEANAKLTPKQKDFQNAINNEASLLAIETIRKRDVEKRVKPAMIFSSSLKGFATEFFQNANEGGAKPAPGEDRNNNMFSAWNIDSAGNLREAVDMFLAKPEVYQLFFIVDLSSDLAGQMLRQAEALQAQGLPVKVITLNLNKVPANVAAQKAESIFRENLAVQAQATALLQTFVTTFTHLTDQDANSNPAVKMTREFTDSMKELRQEGKDLTMSNISEKTKEAKENKRGKARKDLIPKLKALEKKEEQALPGAFQDFSRTINDLALLGGVTSEKIMDVVLGAASKTNFSADAAEAGGLASMLVDVTLDEVGIGNLLGRYTQDFSLKPLTQEVSAYKDAKGIKISFMCPDDLSQERKSRYEESVSDTEGLAEKISQYYLDRFLEEGRQATVYTFALGFMDSFSGNKNLADLKNNINQTLMKLGINVFPMNFPAVAHAGIEAPQALPEVVMGAIFSAEKSFPEGEGQIGSLKIGEGITVNQAGVNYIMSNGGRMAFGGTPLVIVNHTNADDLPWLHDVFTQAMEKFAEKVSSSPVKLTLEKFNSIISAAEEILKKKVKESEWKTPTVLDDQKAAVDLLKEFKQYGSKKVKEGIPAKSVIDLLTPANSLPYVILVTALKEAERKSPAAAESPVKLVEGAEIVTITNTNIKDGKWGTAGYRGKQADPNDFSLDNVRRQTAGFAEEVLERISKGEYKPINGKTVRVAFAFDSRKNSDDYAYEMAKVLAAYKGFEVEIVDEAFPTPVVARLTQKKRANAFDFAFHVTPSHNQLQYGGIKLLFEGSVNEHMWTYFFEKRANSKMEYPINPNVQLKKIHIADQMIEEYFKAVFPGLIEKFASFKRLNPNAQFTVDLMDGSMTTFASLFERLGIKVVRKGQMKNIDYSGRKYELIKGKDPVGFAPDPTKSVFYRDEPEYKEFQEKAPDGSVYFLIDGDGDRLVTIVKKDGELNTVKPNQFGPLAFDYILSNKLIPEMKRLVRTYVTTAGVDAVAKYHGLPDPVIVPVGSKYFNRHFQEAGGLEESGHFVVPGFFDDTIYQIGLILSMMSDTNKDLFTLLAETQEKTGYKGVDKRDDFENISVEVSDKFIAPLVGAPEEVRVKSQKAIDSIVAQSGKELLEALVVVKGEYDVGRVVKLEEYVNSLFTDNPLVIEDNNKGIIVRFKDLSWGGARLSGTGDTGRLYTEGRESQEERKKIADRFINTLDLPKAASLPLKNVGEESIIDDEEGAGFGSTESEIDPSLRGLRMRNDNSEAGTPYGGIDLGNIDVAASPNSIPVNMPPINPATFQGFTFRIIKIEPIINLSSIFGPSEKLADDARPKEQLAYLKE